MDTTIKDIAQRAGLSYSTVSRALNGKYGVHRETCDRVQGIAAEMRYRPNAIARGLINRKTETIGLIIPDLRNPFFPEVAAGIEAASESAGYSVFLCASDWSPRREDNYLSLLLERRVDGIVIAPVMRADGRESAEPSGEVPAVYVSSMPHSSSFPYVAIDNRRGGFLATSHLVERNRVPVAFIGAAEAALSLLRGSPSPGGIFAENDDLALSIIESLTENGHSVPADVGVIGFDDISMAECAQSSFRR